jgi:hypothetical protein
MRKIGLGHDGFYQSEKYFKNIADVIRQDFKLLNKMSWGAQMAYDSMQKVTIPVSVHIRRGDYVQNAKTNQIYGSCSPEYYNKALATLAEKLGEDAAKEMHLFVFSDDIEWVKNNLPLPYPATFVSNPSIQDYEELTLMSKCNHHIVANSSFSWWGAWLNPSSQKIMIAPAKWTNGKPSSYKDIVPNSWTKI